MPNESFAFRHSLSDICIDSLNQSNTTGDERCSISSAAPELFARIDANSTNIDLPAGTKGKNIKAYGASYWTRTARLDVQLADGSIQPYFLKVNPLSRYPGKYDRALICRSLWASVEKQ